MFLVFLLRLGVESAPRQAHSLEFSLAKGVPAQECQADFPNGMVCRWDLRLASEPRYTLPSSNYCIPIRAGGAVAAQIGSYFLCSPSSCGRGRGQQGGFPVGSSSGHGCEGGFHHPQGDELLGTAVGCICEAGRKAREITGRCRFSFSLLNPPWFKITWTLLGISYRRENLEWAF